MRGLVLLFAFVFSVGLVSVVGSVPEVEAQKRPGSPQVSERSGAEAVGASISHPGELRMMRDDYTYEGTYGYTLWHSETEDPHDHGGQPEVRVARAPDLEPGEIRKVTRETVSDYPDDLGVSEEKVRVGKSGLRGTAVGPIPGATPYTEVYVTVNNRVYQIDVYGDELDPEGRELLESIRFSKPERSISSLRLPGANSRAALYPEGGPGRETLERSEIEGALGDELAVPSTTSTSPAYSTSSYSTFSVPTYGEKRIYQGCWLAASRFFLQTQQDARANARKGDGIPTGYTILGRPNYWGQYTHGNLGYGRCKSDFYTNDKFAVDYPLNRGDRVYSPFKGGKVVFAGNTRSHRAYGVFVVIRADNGKYVSLSAHLNGLAPGIKRGARVGKNTVIGYAGNSGGTAKIPVGEVHVHQAFYRYPRFRPNGAPYGGRGLQTLYYHYAGTAAGRGPGVYKFGWQKTKTQKAEGDRISN